MTAAPYWTDGQVTLYQGDVLARLADLPADSVHCCVTSPPYYALRDYGTAAWEGGAEDCDHVENYNLKRDNSGGLGNNRWTDGARGGQSSTKSSAIGYRDVCGRCGAMRVDAQIGLEATPEAYVERMVDVFRAVRRVLRPDGTLWLNLGSSYASGKIESDEYVLRDDLTDEERAYVLRELAKQFEKAEALPELRARHESSEQAMQAVLAGSAPKASALPSKDV